MTGKTWKGKQETYALSRMDFDDVIVPCLLRFTFVMRPSTRDWRGGTFGEAYWLLASRSYRDQSEGRSRIIGKCDDFAIASVIREHCRPFEAIMNASLSGNTLIRISPQVKQCPACHSKPPRRENIALLLDSFRQGFPPFPHEILTDNTNDWCRSPIVVPTLEPMPGDGGSFHGWLENTLGNRGEMSSEDND
jgi:hypothetical protein